MSRLNYYLMLFDGYIYEVSIKGCAPIATLSPEEKKVIYDKIEKIRKSRNEWGTTSLNNKPITIKVVQKERVI